MNSLQALEKAAKRDRHLASHDFAEPIHEHVLNLINSGSSPDDVREALRELHRYARENHRSVGPDAYVEVLDALGEKCPPLAG